MEFEKEELEEVIEGEAVYTDPSVTSARPPPKADLVQMLQNPENLIREWSLDERQARNLRSLLIGSGTGAAHKYLSKYIGDVPASLIGSILSSLVAKKFIK